MAQRIRSATAEHLNKAIIASGKTLQQICSEVGLARPNILSMFRLGQTKIPINRIPAIAEACGVPAVPFLRTALTEYHPELWAVINKELGGLLSENDAEWLGILKTIEKVRPVKIDTELWLAAHHFLFDFTKRRGF